MVLLQVVDKFLPSLVGLFNDPVRVLLQLPRRIVQLLNTRIELHLLIVDVEKEPLLEIVSVLVVVNGHSLMLHLLLLDVVLGLIHLVEDPLEILLLFLLV